jgi:hypothetical protein
MPEKDDKKDIINETPNLLEKNECKSIGKKWKRKCPNCGKDIFHTKNNHRNWFEKKKSLCKSCSKIGKYVGRIVSDEHREKISKKLKGKTPKNIELLLANNYNRVISDATRNKMRDSRIAYLKRTNTYYYPNFNLKACEYFDRLNKEMGWNGQYATNGKEYEIGNGKYFIDFYDKERNIVVEYDEPHHYLRDGTLRKSDIQRMNEIKKSLQCRFLRYSVHQKKLKEY